MNSFFLLSMLISQPSGVEVYHVDLEQVVLQIDAGTRAQKRLEVFRERAQKEVQLKERALLKKKKSLTEEQYGKAYVQLQRQIAQLQRSVEEKQRELLKPILAEQQRLMTAVEKQNSGLFILDNALIVRPLEGCAVTAWLVGANRTKDQPLFARKPECQVRRFFLVDYKQVFLGLPETREANHRIAKLKDERQGALNKKQAELSALEKNKGSKAEIERLRRSIAKLAEKYQRELDRREQLEQDQVFRRIDGALTRAQLRQKQVLFLEAGADQERLVPQCAVTRWVIELMNGRANDASLKTYCPQR